MDRIILPYGGLPAERNDAPTPASPAPAYVSVGAGSYHPHAGHGSGHGHGHSQAKGPADYLRAIRRRFWLLLLVGGVLMTSGTMLVLRQKPVFRTSAQIEIVPPQFDSILASLIADDAINLSRRHPRAVRVQSPGAASE